MEATTVDALSQQHHGQIEIDANELINKIANSSVGNISPTRALTQSQQQAATSKSRPSMSTSKPGRAVRSRKGNLLVVFSACGEIRTVSKLPVLTAYFPLKWLRAFWERVHCSWNHR